MESLSWKRFYRSISNRGQFTQQFRSRTAVARITYDWVAGACHMNANLMSAASSQGATHVHRD